MRSWVRGVGIACAAGVLAACFSGLQLNRVGSSTADDGAIIVSFWAESRSGSPAVGMSEADFEIYEDGELISTFESKQKLVPQPATFELQSLLLLDMSGSITGSGDVAALKDAAATYVQQMPDTMELGIYYFDGRANIQPLLPLDAESTDMWWQFGKDAWKMSNRELALRAIDQLDTVCDDPQAPCDPSTNLHGAILEGLYLLGGGLGSFLDTGGQGSSDEKFGSGSWNGEVGSTSAGSLVVFSDGTDRAGRISEDLVLNDIKSTSHAVYSIGLGGEVDRRFLKRVGKDGAVFAADTTTIVEAFSEVASTVADRSNSYYALVYCSPSRQGSHEVRVKGTWNGKSGAMDVAFSADDFDDARVPYCDPEVYVRALLGKDSDTNTKE